MTTCPVCSQSVDMLHGFLLAHRRRDGKRDCRGSGRLVSIPPAAPTLHVVLIRDTPVSHWPTAEAAQAAAATLPGARVVAYQPVNP